MIRYQLFKPEDISNPNGYMAFVSSELELSAYLKRKYAQVLWEHEAGLFDNDFTTPDFDKGNDVEVRGIYPFSDEYVHLIVRRIS